MSRGGHLEGERSSGSLQPGLNLLVRGEFSLRMLALRDNAAKQQPRPSSLKAPASSWTYLVTRGSESWLACWSGLKLWSWFELCPGSIYVLVQIKVFWFELSGLSLNCGPGSSGGQVNFGPDSSGEATPSFSVWVRAVTLQHTA